MNPSTYIQQHGHLRDIVGLQSVLSTYAAINSDEYEDNLHIRKDLLTEEKMRDINEYELEVRIANEALNTWKQEILVDIPKK